jgi:DNA processing protein
MTVGVLGTGLDVIYPKENRRLVAEMIEAGGAIVSQFPLGTPPVGENFPYRNRIISGLSLGVLLVEASERSGSLITARLAMEQNREVMAVPGNITSANSYGTNYLIKAGAKLVQQWQDVVSELPSDISAAILPPRPDDRRAKSSTRQMDLPPAGLDENEMQIWPHLRPDESIHIDDLLEASGLSFGDLNNALVSLDIKDMIRVLPGRYYARKI